MSGIKNIGAVNKVIESLSNLDDIARSRQVATAVAIRQFIEIELSSILGDKLSHFDFEINDIGGTIIIRVKFIDDIAKFIYYGTQPHKITSDSPMPVGGSGFSTVVNHPGTLGKKIEIDSAINRAISGALMSVRSF